MHPKVKQRVLISFLKDMVQPCIFQWQDSSDSSDGNQSDEDILLEPDNLAALQTCQEDRGPSHAVYSEYRETQEEKPAAYHQQQCQAAKLLEHIETILQLNRHSQGSIKNYEDVEIQIYTAKSINLQNQTIQRLIDPKAQVFQKEDYNNMEQLYRDAKKRVQMYSEDVIEKRHNDLVSHARNNPQTLYIIIADEAHFAVTRQTSGNKQAANDTLINSWSPEEHPNVIILQVSNKLQPVTVIGYYIVKLQIISVE